MTTLPTQNIGIGMPAHWDIHLTIPTLRVILLTQLAICWISYQIRMEISQCQYFTILLLIPTLQGPAKNLFMREPTNQEHPFYLFGRGHHPQWKAIHLIAIQYL